MNGLNPDFELSQRLGVILRDFAKVPGGCELLEAAKPLNISIAFDTDMPLQIDARFINRAITLNAHRETHSIMGSIAHEYQHAINLGAGLAPETDDKGHYRPLSDPLSVFRLARMDEASAYTRQAEYLHDLAQTTGYKYTKGGQDEDLARVFEQQLEAGRGDRVTARREVFKKVIDALDPYDVEALRVISLAIEYDRPRRLADPLYAARPVLEATPDTLRKFGARADGSNYLATLTDDELSRHEFTGAIKPRIQQAIGQLEQFSKRINGGPSP